MKYERRKEINNFYKFLNNPEDKEVIEFLQREFEEKNLERKLKGVELIPKSVHEFYDPKTGRHRELGIPYSSPP